MCSATLRRLMPSRMGDRRVRLTAHDRQQNGALEVGHDDGGAQRRAVGTDRDGAGPGVVELPDHHADQGRVLDPQRRVRLVGDGYERDFPVADDDPVDDFGDRPYLGSGRRHLLDVGERRPVRADGVLVDRPLPHSAPQHPQVAGQRLAEDVRGRPPPGCAVSSSSWQLPTAASSALLMTALPTSRVRTGCSSRCTSA